MNIYCQLYWKYKNKEKEAGNGPFFKKIDFEAGALEWPVEQPTQIYLTFSLLNDEHKMHETILRLLQSFSY